MEGFFLAEELDFSQLLFMSTHSVVLRECGRWVCMPPVPVIALRSQAGGDTGGPEPFPENSCSFTTYESGGVVVLDRFGIAKGLQDGVCL